jgi:hypothetical protein
MLANAYDKRVRIGLLALGGLSAAGSVFFPVLAPVGLVVFTYFAFNESRHAAHWRDEMLSYAAKADELNLMLKERMQDPIWRDVYGKEPSK